MPFQTKKITRINTDSLESLGDSVVDLAGHVENEFDRLSSALQATEPEVIWTTPPPKPRTSTIVYADGVHWNPGSGEGLYVYGSDHLWHYLEVPAYVPPAPPPLAAQVLLETINLAGAAAYNSSASWAGYSHIKFIISNLILAASANFPLLQYHSAGAYQTGSYVSGASIVQLSGTPAWNTAATTTTSLVLYAGSDLTVGSIPEGASIEGMIYNIASTTMHKHLLANSAVRSTASAFWSIAVGTWTGGLTAIDGLKLTSNSANLNSGKLQIYGVL